MSTRDALRTYIASTFGWEGPTSELTDELPLIEGKVIDSLGLLQLVAAVETKFGIDVDDKDIVLGNFATIDAIARYVERRLAA